MAMLEITKKTYEKQIYTFKQRTACRATLSQQKRRKFMHRYNTTPELIYNDRRMIESGLFESVM